jgi:argininosuccinate lyase
MDACLYLSQNFAFIQLPSAYTTGSSIMPHKKNPDVFEIMRGRCNQLMSLPNQIMMLMGNLPSGYHREMQLMKESVFPAMEDLNAVLDAMIAIIPNIQPVENILEDEKYRYLFTVDAVHEKVREGLTFRDAYKAVGDEIENGQYQFDPKSATSHSLQGSIGNLGLNRLQERLQIELQSFDAKKVDEAEKRLLD